MASPVPSYLEVLNPEQREAVLHEGKPLLILAGAGSGKTRVITTKIAYLIRERGVDPRAILAVTFTNKAAREMAERARLIDGRAGDAMLRTFHSFGAWFLRRNGRLGGLESGFVIYDEDDSVALLGTIMEGAPRAEVRATAGKIQRAKDYFISPDDPELDSIDHGKTFKAVYRKYEEKLASIGNVDFGDLIRKPVEILRNEPEVARRFRERFRVILVDEYQDANVAQSELLKELYSPGAYICVVGDDDQSIYRFRGAEVRNILEFPERFEGAEIVRLERNYRSTAPILRAAASVVDHNRGRLGKKLKSERGDGKTPVLAFLPDQDTETEFCANLILKHAENGKPYSDWAIIYRTNAQSLGFETEFLRRRIPYRVVGSLKFYEREEVKDALALLSFLVNPRDEVAFRRVVNKPARGVGPATVDRVVGAAVGEGGNLLLAAQRLAPELSAKARAGIAVFIKSIEAGMEALSLTRGHGTEAWGHGAESRGHGAEARGHGAESRGHGAEARGHGAESRGHGAESRGHGAEARGHGAEARGHGAEARGHGAEAADKRPPKAEGTGRQPERLALPVPGLRSGEGLSECVVNMVAESGLAEHYLAEDEIAGNQRLANLQEVANAASLYAATVDGLLEFLEHIELDRSMEEAKVTEGDQGIGTDAVTLITMHNTKGLEFRRVIMTGIEQGIFPRDDKKGDDLEEERRLFYVGATRAMDELYLTSCAYRRMYGRTDSMLPSLFLKEIDRDGLRVVGSAPYGFTAAGGGRQGGRAQAGFAGRAAGIQPPQSSDGRWALGDRVFHDDHGYGQVTQIREGDDGPVVKVVFETGHETRFLSLHQSAKFTKIKDD